MENTIYSINIGDVTFGETTYHNRCLSANYGMLPNAIPSDTIPWENEEKEVISNPWDWKYENGEFVFDAIEMPTQTPVPTEMEKLISVLLKSGKLTKEEYNYIIGE